MKKKRKAKWKKAKRKKSKRRSRQLRPSHRPLREKRMTSGTLSKGGTGKHPVREAIEKRGQPVVPADEVTSRVAVALVVVDRAPAKALPAIVEKKLPRQSPKANGKIGHVVEATQGVVNELNATGKYGEAAKLAAASAADDRLPAATRVMLGGLARLNFVLSYGAGGGVEALCGQAKVMRMVGPLAVDGGALQRAAAEEAEARLEQAKGPRWWAVCGLAAAPGGGGGGASGGGGGAPGGAASLAVPFTAAVASSTTATHGSSGAAVPWVFPSTP